MLLAAQPSRAENPDNDVPSLEDLMKVEVSSVARRAQALADTPAAVYVVTAEDIERSGVTSVPEALRLVPGVNVARISNAMWAVTIRGFNGRFANKLLVMLDGRSVYSPLFSGTLWEAQDTLLEDVDRIEVIRGPGAAMWGANAVNGVINIITKRARSTQGTQVVAAGGTTESAAASLRHGVAFADDAHLRLYAKGFAVESSETLDGRRGRDE
ncbi:MAG TPA: TonB-dependent receptor plug domain-containing protein [Rhodocyclaceae bacterium]|nr:TonB-dependent receptor plug domain-containing protein [Rhodocyclaceae bacterium]